MHLFFKQYNRLRIKKYISISFIIVCLFASACAPSRFVKPLEKGKYAAGVNLGGPLFDFSGMTIPMPFSAIGGGYGLTDKTTVYSSLHTTALLFGVVMIDAGLTKEIIPPSGYIPGISISPAFNLAVDIWEGNLKCWPQLDANAYWNPGSKKNLFYAGVSNWFESTKLRADGEKQRQHWIFSPQLGYSLIRPKMEYSLECKFVNAFASNKNIVVEYKSFGSKGAIGIYLNLLRKF